MDNLRFIELTQSELNIVGSGVGGAIVGGLVGWTVGLPIALGYALIRGENNEAKDTMNICNTCASVGAYLGAFSPTI